MVFCVLYPDGPQRESVNASACELHGAEQWSGNWGN